MAIITLRNLSLSYGQQPLLDQINLAIEAGERLCLVGRNGAGKSSLLGVIAGEIQADDGELSIQDGLRIARLAQAFAPDTAGSVYQVVAAGLGDMGALIARYETLAAQVSTTQDPASLAELEACQHAIETADGWTLQPRITATLEQFGLEPTAAFTQLSGGLKRRVLLAQTWVKQPDLLLLDEPTNHLDIDAITWLETFLRNWPGTLLFITHDRAFLQSLATRIIELDRGQLNDFPGDYTTYLQRKAELQAAEDKQQALFDKKLAQEEAWVRQGIKARRTRNEGRVRALEQMRQARAARREQLGQARLAVQDAERSGKLVVAADKVALQLGERWLIRDLTTTILRGDKIGIIGPNGIGKTSLLRLLLGELPPTQGRLRLGTKLAPVYFDQHRASLDDTQTVQANVGQGREMLTINGQTRHVLSYLQDFLFSPARARQPISALSGGERNRLLLAKLFTQPANLLVLDEPTNDLDAETLELLEALLVEFNGTVLLVSHDRAFLDNVVSSSLVFTGAGEVHEYVGGYSDWLRQRPAPTAAPAKPAAPAKTAAAPKPQNDGKRLGYKEQRELAELPERIETLEAELEPIQARLADPAFYRQPDSDVAATQARLAELEEALQTAYSRWETLEAHAR